MRVDAIWQHPVKSMIGQRVARAEVTELGMRGDRAWAVRDEVRGGIRGAKKIGELMKLAARYVDGVGGPVEVTLPGGATVLSSDPDVHGRISAALGLEITLWPLQPRDELEHDGRGAPDHSNTLDEKRAIIGRETAEPLPDIRRFPPIITTDESPRGTYYDAYPLLLMTTAALRSLERALPGSAVDVRRFRPNIVIDTDHDDDDEPGHPEQEWIGRRLEIGDVVVEIVDSCPRCVMVTHEIDERAPADRAVLRHIVRDLDQNVGVYATVVTSGTVAVGAVVSVV